MCAMAEKMLGGDFFWVALLRPGIWGVLQFTRLLFYIRCLPRRPPFRRRGSGLCCLCAWESFAAHESYWERRPQSSSPGDVAFGSCGIRRPCSLYYSKGVSPDIVFSLLKKKEMTASLSRNAIPAMSRSSDFSDPFAAQQAKSLGIPEIPSGSRIGEATGRVSPFEGISIRFSFRFRCPILFSFLPSQDRAYCKCTPDHLVFPSPRPS